MSEPLFVANAVSGPRFPEVGFRLDAREMLLVEGVSGSGKSQMLRALADLDPHDGEVRLAGKRQCDMAPAEWRRSVMLIPAESAWWGDVVHEHFSVSPATDWLDRLSLRHSLMDAPVERLSSGERQRLAVLRALVQSPRVLLLDEPTANLDTRNSEAISELIREYLDRQGAAAVWVTHDPAEQARLSGRRLSLEPSHPEVHA